jgi:NADH-quinone oxidoreductase subunit L
MRVDTLSVTMMLVVTGVGSLIHMYAIGYMHGDPRIHRFFAYLNMFLAFMLVLVTGNNLLMLFVGWEGVGLCSFLLIGFWFDKAKGVGWRNSNAARKAMIVNRIGDFGLIMGIFLAFWAFGTLDFYRPGEIANEALAGHSTEAAVTEGEHEEAAVTEGEHTATGETVYTNNDHIPTEQLGIFGQTERFVEEGRSVTFGPFTLPIATVITLITLLMLLGAAGKSAQIPLFIWLPDAMAGPTPVSALIHAATMVTAGVYLMVRSNVLFHHSDLTSLIVALIGASTALVAGFIAIGQWDIKRVLAYSTISQLGFMVAAVGVGAYSAAMFHLVTHAFFKALLFLGSGSVIHGVEHGDHAVSHGHGDAHDPHDAAAHPEHEEEEFDPQDMRNMGGLRQKMPVTYWTYLIGTLALAGIFPFAGFWSKDEILADSWLAGIVEGRLGGYVALALLLLAAGFTAFYMWRQVALVFLGQPRTEAAQHAHESPPTMTLALLALAVLSIVGGFLNVPTGALGLENVFGAHRLTFWLEQSVANAHGAEFQWVIALGALALAIGAIFLADNIYRRQGLAEGRRDPLYVNAGFRPIWRLANARLYWDETYSRLFEQPFNRAAKFLADTVDWAFLHDYFHDTIIVKGFNTIGDLLSRPVDLGIIDGIVNGLGRLAQALAASMRRLQTGYVRVYAISLLLGVVLVIILLLLPLLGRG